jgi:membrane-bound lytic murein transglycosylase MltF
MARRGLRHGRPGHRFAFLTVTAALGAVGVALISPPTPGQAVTTEASIATTVDDSGEVSAQAAAAIPQAQARAHTIADITAQRTAAAQAAQAAQAAAAEHANAGPDDFRAYAKQKVGATQFGCLDKLWTRESHWQADADNPSSTAYGIAQLLDSTWAHTGVRKTSDGYRQVDAGLVYIDKVYGSPCNAWAHETNKGWY